MNVFTVKGIVGGGNVMWHKESRSFSAEASDIFERGSPSIPPRISIKSEKTGTIKDFDYVGVSRDNEGDVRYWGYRNVELGINLTVFND